ncbi:hypothetical protein CALVIDRAFT_562114 [Calocera viscosa TUFC12733]|uniref:Carbohydrate-binding module family 50 protein n=1 Tax=Calocera viscosa (strain TUFC12733) TaxID=1330018 RepID=A0A167PDT0_CALVF|nr:hypothetical protein CALVIDRAFT_562114 [Calocera viscosa TUFC12733]
MQLSVSQALVLALVLLDGAQGAVIPRSQGSVDARQVNEPRLLVETIADVAELLPGHADALAVLREHAARGGPLDPILAPLAGVLGALPGLLSGVLGSVTSVVGGLLGTVGNLLITDPSSGVQGMHVYLIQAGNTSLAMADATNVTNPAILAAANMSDPTAILATLHVPVVNQTTMSIVDLCVTSTGPGANNITASPCQDKSLSQLFVYNTVTNAVFSVPDLLACAYTNANATGASTPAGGPLTGTANIIMVERDTPTLSTCNATSKAIMFTPSSASQAVVTVTPAQASSVASTAGSTLDYAAGDHDPAAMSDGTEQNGGW